ncbi:TPA: F-box protein [Legionella pneumophila subsp. pneumophila]|uniref:F-box protein n=1 Tax=Legionella sp. PATHC039 TaxID=2992042 RepID=UPI001A218033|nr:F-box protein [Legionella sp. PATHC039]MCW8396190.1 F-box protein [Legionella sp. PATHC039]HAT9649720.1 F-box protein [Legionella pneumophila subsp. pneumophila]HAT9918976.1 F-box protein [Legionella pneumophila subsp. pneumophila]
MQEQFEFPFDELPKDIRETEIGQYLKLPDFAHLIQSSKANQTLFKPLLDEQKLPTFLHRAVRREDDAVQKILINDPTLLSKRGKVTDCSGRTFENISAFEYMLWALDKHGWTMLLECIPKTKNNEELVKELLAQYNKVKNEGVTYTLNGIKITEQHFDFKNTIIKELQDQVDASNVPNPNWDSIDKQWREGVGGAQKLFPMHVVYEYCSDEPFDPVPKFKSKPKSSSQFYNWITNKLESWVSSDSLLGGEFAIYKAAGEVARAGAVGSRLLVRASCDLVAMKALYEIRTSDFIVLKSTLENLLKPAVKLEHKDIIKGA